MGMLNNVSLGDPSFSVSTLKTSDDTNYVDLDVLQKHVPIKRNNTKIIKIKRNDKKTDKRSDKRKKLSTKTTLNLPFSVGTLENETDVCLELKKNNLEEAF